MSRLYTIYYSIIYKLSNSLCLHLTRERSETESATSECPICYNNVKYLVKTTCSHISCINCFTTICKNSGNKNFICSFCRQIIENGYIISAVDYDAISSMSPYIPESESSEDNSISNSNTSSFKKNELNSVNDNNYSLGYSSSSSNMKASKNESEANNYSLSHRNGLSKCTSRSCSRTDRVNKFNKKSSERNKVNSMRSISSNDNNNYSIKRSKSASGSKSHKNSSHHKINPEQYAFDSNISEISNEFDNLENIGKNDFDVNVKLLQIKVDAILVKKKKQMKSVNYRISEQAILDLYVRRLENDDTLNNNIGRYRYLD